MARKPPQKSTWLSGAARDKLTACLNHANTSQDKQEQAYFDACSRWFTLLSPDNCETALRVIDCYSGPHRKAAEGIATSLPPAPRCQL
ncbi:MAG TPA: hypothetical protein VGX03_29030 [Candidatus Binatia bacterium]|nr:hypothetical protein [Candidatus Binatia bacterium]